MWSATFSVSTAVVCVCCAIIAVWSARNAARVAASPLAKLRSSESRIASLETSVSELTELQTELANRLKMMRVRNSTAGPRSSAETIPDPHRDPDGWRKAMNLKIAQSRLQGIN